MNPGETRVPPHLGDNIKPAAQLCIGSCTLFFAALATWIVPLNLSMLYAAHYTIQVYLVAVHKMIYPASASWRKTYLPIEFFLVSLLVWAKAEQESS